MNTVKYKIGTKLNYLTILKITRTKPFSKVLCKCVCGIEKEFYLSNILPRKGKSRYTKSCGCKRYELVLGKISTHGLSKTKFYRHWRSMHDRLSPNYINTSSYVGIKICKRWSKFENFKKDMYESWYRHNKKNGGRETTLDRINVLKDYCKENCRWATQAEQSLNKKNTFYVVYKGEKIPLKILCEKLNKKYDRVYHRLKYGFTLDKSLFLEPWVREQNQ